MLCCINKDQLKDLGSNDTVDGSTLGDNLITSHQVNCMSSALIPTEAVQNYQEHVTSCSNKIVNITPLV